MNQQQAAEALNLSKRQIQRLVKSGRLRMQPGGGIDKDSVDSYRANKKKSDISQNVVLECRTDSGYQVIVKQLLRTIPALSDAAQTAKRLGVPITKIEALMNSKAIPTVTLGSQRYVPARFLIPLVAEAYGIPAGGSR